VIEQASSDLLDMSSSRDETENKRRGGVSVSEDLIRTSSIVGVGAGAGACVLAAPDDLFQRLKQRGLVPLERDSIFLKGTPPPHPLLCCDTVQSSDGDDADAKTTSKTKDKKARASDLRYTKMLLKRFPYSFSSIRHAMCFPFTFAMQPEPWSTFASTHLEHKGQYGPIKLHIPKTAIEAQWGNVMNFKQGDYHLMPLEVRTLAIRSQDVPLQLAYRLLSSAPKDANSSAASYESPSEWTFSTRVISDVQSRIPNGVIPASGQSLTEKDRVTWQADVDIIRSDRAQMMKFFKPDQLSCYTTSKELQLTYPKSAKSRIDDVLAWVMITAFPDTNITKFWMHDAGRLVKDKADDADDEDDGGDDEEHDDDQEEKTEDDGDGDGDGDDGDDVDDDDHPRAVAQVKKFERTSINSTVQQVLKDVNNPKTLMSLDDGLTLEIVPAEPGGWDVFRRKVERASPMAPLVTANPNHYDPLMHLSIEIGIVAIPIVASPHNFQVSNDKAIHVGFASRNVSDWAMSSQ
jgi:hypothetical protein